MTETERLLEEFRLLGGTFKLRGEEITVGYPDETAGQVKPVLEQLRAKKDEVRSLLNQQPPGVFAAPECPSLPPGVRLKRYAPKDPTLASVGIPPTLCGTSGTWALMGTRTAAASSVSICEAWSSVRARVNVEKSE